MNNELLEVISPWLAGVMFLSIIFFILGFIIIFVTTVQKGYVQVSSNQKIIYIILALVFLFSFAIEKYRTYFILNKIQSMLNNNAVTIKLEGKIILDKKQFRQDYSKISHFKQSGSSPRAIFNIHITTPTEKLYIHFKRDSRNKNLYWIFYPAYTYKGNLGYIKTKLFSNYE